MRIFGEDGITKGKRVVGAHGTKRGRKGEIAIAIAEHPIEIDDRIIARHSRILQCRGNGRGFVGGGLQSAGVAAAAAANADAAAAASRKRK